MIFPLQKFCPTLTFWIIKG